MSEVKEVKKTGYVGFVGLPNSGKSTLLNTLLGEKVCIVSTKPQATRRRIQGILTHENYQMVLVDSPGYMMEASTPLHDFILQEARDVIATVSVVVILVPMDLDKGEDLQTLTAAVKASKKPYVYCLTKSDLNPSKVSTACKQGIIMSGEPYFTASAKQSRLILTQDIIKILDPYLAETEEFPFSAEEFTTERSRDLVAEYIREACMEYLAKEIPYNIAVAIDSYKTDEKLPKIYASIFVNRESHKSIVIGKGGEKLKQIGIYARQRFEDVLGEKIFLSLRVKTKEDWAKNKTFMNEMGYGKNK
jgi:GTPase